MSWTKLDDGFPDHPKVDGLSHGAFRLHVSALCHCARNLTDGFIATDRPPRLIPQYRAGYVMELVVAGLWDEAAGGWLLHDYLDYNAAASAVKASRVLAAERQGRWRQKQPRNAVTNGVTNGERAAVVTPTPSHPLEITTPSLPSQRSEPVVPEAEGGRGCAEQTDPQADPDRTWPMAALGAIDDELRRLCPPGLDRLFGAPRRSAVKALVGGADLDLILAAVRSAGAAEGAKLRWERAEAALRTGRVGPAGAPQPAPIVRSTFGADPPVDPVAARAAILAARKALRQEAAGGVAPPVVGNAPRIGITGGSASVRHQSGDATSGR